MGYLGSKNIKTLRIKPKFVKEYVDLKSSIKKAVQNYSIEVLNKKFPKNKNTY